MSKIDYNSLLANLGEDAVPLGELKFGSKLEEALVKFAEGISAAMKSNLDETNDYMKSSQLRQSIAVLPVEVMGTSYTAVIEGANYAFFVNSGVNGLTRKFGSPFSFKTRFPSPDMVKSLSTWISRKGIPLKTRYSQTRQLSKKARATAQIDEKTKMATAFAFGIKQKGLKPTLFIDNAITDAEIVKMQTAIANFYEKQISISIDKTIWL
jgi:hypothetical protein